MDDLSGLPLKPDLCRAAHANELEYFSAKQVWDVRYLNEAHRRKGRALISVTKGMTRAAISVAG